MKKIKIAIIGCGRISKNHVSALQNLASDFEISSVCDTDLERVTETASELNVTHYCNLETLLKDDRPDIISLCTPSGIHPAQTILAAKHGVHVLTEKPMACKYEQALAAIHACDEAGTKLFVVKQNN